MLDKNEVRMGRCALQAMVQELLLEGGFQQIILEARQQGQMQCMQGVCYIEGWNHKEKKQSARHESLMCFNNAALCALTIQHYVLQQCLAIWNVAEHFQIQAKLDQNKCPVQQKLPWAETSWQLQPCKPLGGWLWLASTSSASQIQPLQSAWHQTMAGAQK